MTIAARSLLAGALAVHLLVAAFAAVDSGAPSPDFDRYWQIASERGIPYRDFQVEHPIGTLLLFRALAAATGGRAPFAFAIVVLNLVADLTIVAALAWAWGAAAAAAFAIGLLPLVELLFNRLDLWSMAAATLAVALFRRDRPLPAGVLLAVGMAFKLWPMVLGMTFLAAPPRMRGARALGAASIAFGIFLATWWGLAGLRGFYQVLTFRGATGWQIESTIGSLIRIVRAAPIRFEADSWRVGSTTGPISILMSVVALPAACWAVWRAGRAGRVGAGWLAAVSTLLLLSALLSAQFIGWLIPGAAIAWGEGDRPAALTTWVVALLTRIFTSSLYGSVLSGSSAALALVVARNVVLAVLLFVSLRTIAARAMVSVDCSGAT